MGLFKKEVKDYLFPDQVVHYSHFRGELDMGSCILPTTRLLGTIDERIYEHFKGHSSSIDILKFRAALNISGQPIVVIKLNDKTRKWSRKDLANYLEFETERHLLRKILPETKPGEPTPTLVYLYQDARCFAPQNYKLAAEVMRQTRELLEAEKPTEKQLKDYWDLAQKCEPWAPYLAKGMVYLASAVCLSALAVTAAILLSPAVAAVLPFGAIAAGATAGVAAGVSALGCVANRLYYRHQFSENDEGVSFFRMNNKLTLLNDMFNMHQEASMRATFE